MHTKALLQEVKSLHQPKFRQMYDNFIAEGEKVCLELLKHRRYEVKMIFTTSDSNVKIVPENLLHIHYPITSKEMSQISALVTPTNILVVLAQGSNNNISQQIDFSKAIYLDGVQDPGNVGTIIRIADWFGIDAVIRSVQSADFYNPKTVQATMGSIANVKLFTADLGSLISKNFAFIGTDMQGKDINSYSLPKEGIIVMGSEGKGISPENKEHITDWIKIPGVDTRIADSLNVGIATGIICSKW